MFNILILSLSLLISLIFSLNYIQLELCVSSISIMSVIIFLLFYHVYLSKSYNSILYHTIHTTIFYIILFIQMYFCYPFTFFWHNITSSRYGRATSTTSLKHTGPNSQRRFVDKPWFSYVIMTRFTRFLQTWFVKNKRRFGETKGGLSSNLALWIRATAFSWANFQYRVNQKKIYT